MSDATLNRQVRVLSNLFTPKENMTTTYYLHGSQAALDAISGLISHRHKSRAIAILPDDQGGIPRALIMREHQGDVPDLSWLVGALGMLQQEHERGQPWSEAQKKRALKAWRAAKDRIAAAEFELEKAKADLPSKARQVVLTHGNRTIHDGETKLVPGYAACNDVVYLVESAADVHPTTGRLGR